MYITRVNVCECAHSVGVCKYRVSISADFMSHCACECASAVSVCKIVQIKLQRGLHIEFSRHFLY